MTRIDVQPIASSEATAWLMLRHYAHRLCPVSYAFGAYRETELIGVVTFGVPASSPLRNGIAGEDYAQFVIELNRLCCENTMNVASRLVGRALALLPQPSIVVSFADCGYGHVGYVYQACNFIYTGLSAKRTNWKIRGEEHLHGATVADRSRGQANRAEWMRATYGADFYLEQRSRKHRYLYLCGNRKQRQAMSASLRYPRSPYPKGETVRHESGVEFATQRRLLI